MLIICNTFLLQQWLHEQASALLYTYTAHQVLDFFHLGLTFLLYWNKYNLYQGKTNFLYASQ